MKIDKKQFEKKAGWVLKEKYHGKINKKYKADLKRLKKGEPVDYVIGFKHFLGCRIDLSKKPLIPRTETEFWVSQALEEVRRAIALKKSSEDVKSIVRRSWGHENYEIKVLDIFAGSGCIGLAVLANTLDAPGVTVDFAEKDAKAIAQIKINLKNNLIEPARYRVFQADVFKAKPAFAKSFGAAKYDFIFANPPYIPTTRKSKVDKSVLKYEPKKALFGGRDGLLYIKKFLAQAKKHLNANGQIFMEFDYIQQKGIEKLLKQYKYSKWQFLKDQYGKVRYVVIS